VEGIVVAATPAGANSAYPTANLLTSPHAAVRPTGCTRWLAPDGAPPLRAACRSAPTRRSRAERRVEAYVLDFDAIYGERLALDFVARLRSSALRRVDPVAQIGRTSPTPGRPSGRGATVVNLAWRVTDPRR
jgi:FAD synthase